MDVDVYIDFETYSECDIKTSGAWVYSMHPSTEVLCMAVYSPSKDRKPYLLNNTDEIKGHLNTFILKGYRMHARNSAFEYAIMRNVLKIEGVEPYDLYDTMALSASCSLPHSLEGSGAALTLEQDKQKLTTGKKLIRALCMPQKDGTRNNDPLLLNDLHKYCLQDVVADYEIHKEIIKQGGLEEDIEQHIWRLDQEVNHRGVRFDIDRVNDAMVIIDQVEKKLNKEVFKISKGVLEDTNSRKQVLSFCAAIGEPLEGYTKGYLSETLKKGDLNPIVRRLIEIRLMLGRTSLAKYKAIPPILDGRKRAVGLLQYYGSHTGRWSGRQFQPQNLPRGFFKNPENIIDLLKYRDLDLLELIFDDATLALSSCIRGMIIADKGKRLIVSDYSAIEGRVLAWLAGQEDVLNVFRNDGKIYEYTASIIYGVKVGQVSKDQRFIGKVATLALGYQGGANAFKKMAEQFGTDIDPVFAESIKNNWRSSNSEIVNFWYALNDIVLKAIRTPGSTYTYRSKYTSIACKVNRNFLLIKLPSGRHLHYYKPRIEKGKYGDKITYWGVDSTTRQWTKQDTYGGKLAENVTQAVSRDLTAIAMMTLNKKYPVVLMVHDEVISEVDKDKCDLDNFNSIMKTIPSWAKGLPIEVEGYVSKRYRK